MQEEGVECSRCGAAFDSQNELIVHSIDSHSGVDASTGGGRAMRGGGHDAATPRQTDALDADAVERLTTAIEEQAAPGATVGYRQRFIAVASVAILAVALVLSYLHFTGVLETTVFMFALGTLFGLTLSYLQVFLRSVRG